jgi:hypothetical protein
MCLRDVTCVARISGGAADGIVKSVVVICDRHDGRRTMNDHRAFPSSSQRRDALLHQQLDRVGSARNIGEITHAQRALVSSSIDQLKSHDTPRVREVRSEAVASTTRTANERTPDLTQAVIGLSAR